MSCTVAKGDKRVLSRDNMITREHAKRELVAKGPANAQQLKGKGRQQEEQVALPSSVAEADDNGTADDGNKSGLAPSLTSSTPPMHCLVDSLDDGKPLTTSSEESLDPALFYDDMPLASSSCVKL